MKKTNKMIAGMLTGVMMLSCVSVSAEYTTTTTVNDDEKSINVAYGTSALAESVDSAAEHVPEWKKNFEVLKEYGIFVGYDDGDAKPYNTLTRAETAKALCVALGINPESTTEQHFSDVDSSHWAYKYINALADMKIVAGTENNLFEPDRATEINEVVKMLVCALGYETRADVMGGYPNGYIQTARSIGLADGLELNNDVTMCARYKAFILFRNALDIPFLVVKGYKNGSAEFVVADGEDGRDYITMRYKITGERNEG